MFLNAEEKRHIDEREGSLSKNRWSFTEVFAGDDPTIRRKNVWLSRKIVET
jgi:hypothetical protein